MLKALSAGVVVALLAVVAVVAVAVSGIAPNMVPSTTADRLIVMAIGADAEGTEVVLFAYATGREGRDIEILDTGSRVTVPGASARTPREAYAYVGPEGVSELLSSQVDEEQSAWLVLPLVEWTTLIDANGGVEIDVPGAISAYDGTDLVIIDQGRQKLLGRESGVLASAVDFQDDADAARLNREFTEAIAELVGDNSSDISALLSQGRVSSSMTPDALKSFLAGP